MYYVEVYKIIEIVGGNNTMSFGPQKISLEEAHSSGIDVNFEQMMNGEKRYRLVASDGSSYCRTVGSEQGAWQNSHYHKYVSELYLVQFGWIGYAEIDKNGDLKVHILHENEIVTVKPYVHHNIYMPANSVTHTIKYGSSGEEIDWFPSKELDIFTKNISEKDLLQLSKIKEK
ncbi:hypothetical protein [Lederbergia graminis]|uniref:Cupin type-1 domain-containing protein n=1 Tax=Lederbergia graminis TaxID=735518 RepID=A0ABW0LE28_9BACI|nr:hypothetical protein [Bacillaceae bacterium]